MTGTTSPARAGRLYRDWVSMRLRSLGLTEAKARNTQARRPRKLSDALLLAEAHGGPRGDVLGVPKFAIATSFRNPMNIAAALEQAKIAAALDGSPHWAAVVARPGVPVENSYVITTLDALAEMARA